MIKNLRKMIYDWKEVKLKTFEEILESYWNNSKNTIDKVIEVQHMPSLILSKSNIRVFFGNKINILDWKEENSEILQEIKKCKLSKFNLTMCMTEGYPRIYPLSQNHYDVISKVYDKFLEKYLFTRDSNGNIYFDIEKKIPIESQLIRIRGIDYSDWKDEVDFFYKNTCFIKSFTENYVKLY